LDMVGQAKENQFEDENITRGATEPVPLTL
jgi:hypothetical protein